MRRLVTLGLAATLALTACQTPQGTNPVITPQRCETALTTAGNVAQLVALLESFGYLPAKARAIAPLIQLGSMAAGAVCAILNPGPKPVDSAVSPG